MTLSEATWSLSRFTSGRHCHFRLLLRLRETLNELIIPFVISGVFPIGHHRSRDTCWVPRELIPLYIKPPKNSAILADTICWSHESVSWETSDWLEKRGKKNFTLSSDFWKVYLHHITTSQYYEVHSRIVPFKSDLSNNSLLMALSKEKWFFTFGASIKFME